MRREGRGQQVELPEWLALLGSALGDKSGCRLGVDRHPREDDCCQCRDGSLPFPASRLDRPTATWSWQPASWVGVTLCALSQHCLSMQVGSRDGKLPRREAQVQGAADKVSRQGGQGRRPLR